MMFKDNPEGQTQYEIPSGDSTEEMRREFEATYTQYKWSEKATFHDQQYTVQLCWQLAWNAAIASKQEELAQDKEQIRKLKSELEDANAMNLLGTQQCIYTDVSNALKQANATIAALETEVTNFKTALKTAQELINAKNAKVAALQAKIEKADKQEPFSVLRCDSLELKPTPLFTRPPITSERELDLLGVIEQMRNAFQEVIRISDRKHDAWDRAKEALALTPDMAALKETFAPLAGSKTQHLTGSTD